jgi:hypothetical protein
MSLFAILSIVTGYGEYSTQYGPYWLATILAVCVTIWTKGLIGLSISKFEILAIIPGLLIYIFLIFSTMSIAAPQAQGLFVQSITWLVAFLLFCRLLSSDELAGTVAVYLAIGAAICSILNIYEFLFAQNTWSTATGRSAGFFRNPNVSAFAILGSFLVAYEMHPRIYRTLIYMTFPISVIGIIVTFSRGAIVTAIALAIVVATRNKAALRTAIPVLLLITLTTIIVTPLIIQYYESTDLLSDDAILRIESIVNFDFSDDSSDGRSNLVGLYTDLFLDNFISGYMPFYSISLQDGLGPHNNYLGLGVDFGAVIVLIFIYSIAQGFFGDKLNTDGISGRNPSFLLSLFFLISCVFSHNLVYSAIGAAILGTIAGLRAFSQVHSVLRVNPVIPAKFGSPSAPNAPLC